MSLCLALHADDFGMNQAVSDGILHGFRQGLSTSTSLLSNAPDAARALSHWKELLVERAAGRLPSSDVRRRLGDPDVPFDLGVHLNLTQGRPLDDRYPAELLDAEGRFPGVFSLFARLRRSGGKWREAIRGEWRRQIEFLCDHGLRPTHLNGHQYVEMLPATAELVPELMTHFGIKSVRIAWEPALLRNIALHGFRIAKWPLARVKHVFATRFRTLIDARRIAHPDAFFGTAHAGGVDLKLLQLFLASGRCYKSIEIGLHPGHSAEEPSAEDQSNGWRDPLALSRPRELQMLVSADLPRCLESHSRRLSRFQLLQ
ncbi:MAG: ChbG/HpnK family deacetylase [Thermoguttaceae bacterium]